MIHSDILRAIEGLKHAAMVYSRVLLTCKEEYTGMEQLRRAEYELHSAEENLKAAVANLERNCLESKA